MDVELERIIGSPKLSLYAQKIQDVLAAEQQKRQEFYELIDEDDKAEFINGEIIFHSPVKLRHNVVSHLLLRLLGTYVQIHSLGFVGHEKIMISLSRNDYEPDLCFFKQEKAQHFTADQARFPGPDFIIEVLSPNIEANDRGIKFEDYAAHGVDEYWLVDPETEIVEQYELRDEQYHLRLKVSSGELESIAVTDFKLPVRAIFDETKNLQTLQKMMAAV